MVLRIKVAICVLFMSCSLGFGQSESMAPRSKEIWNQKKTNIEYLTKFILANGAKLYIMSQGKEISDLRLGAIQGEKEKSYDGDFEYIEELSKVPNIIAESTALVNIVKNQRSILRYIRETEKLLGDNSDIVPSKSSQMYDETIMGLEKSVLSSLEELEIIIMKNDLKFKDNERLELLIEMAREYDGKTKFAHMIYTKAFQEVKFINRELKSINEIKEYNGID